MYSGLIIKPKLTPVPKIKARKELLNCVMTLKSMSPFQIGVRHWFILLGLIFHAWLETRQQDEIDDIQIRSKSYLYGSGDRSEPQQ